MIIAIQGTRNFDDYQVFLRAMRTSLGDLDENDNSITIYSAGPANVNSMGMEFVNITERSLKARNINIKLRKVPASWLSDHLYEVDYFAFFCLRKEPSSKLFQEAEAKGIDGHIYQFR